eukprot:246013-Chlamydomonas_euryale.AAC.2
MSRTCSVVCTSSCPWFLRARKGGGGVHGGRSEGMRAVAGRRLHVQLSLVPAGAEGAWRAVGRHEGRGRVSSARPAVPGSCGRGEAGGWEASRCGREQVWEASRCGSCGWAGTEE